MLMMIRVASRRASSLLLGSLCRCRSTLPLGRQQAPNPAALSLSLLAVEDDDELVHVLVAQRAVHQAHYPPFEALLP